MDPTGEVDYGGCVRTRRGLVALVPRHVFRGAREAAEQVLVEVRHPLPDDRREHELGPELVAQRPCQVGSEPTQVAGLDIGQIVQVGRMASLSMMT